MFARTTAVFALLLLTLGAVASPQSITIPAGTSVHFRLNETINTATAKSGTRVSGELTKPIVINGKTVANEGAPVTVKITNAEASGRIGGSAHLTFHVSSIKLANGQRADVSTSSYSREGKAHAKHNATYIATAGVVGALAGQALGGNRNSTAKGAAIGAGVGIGAAAATGKFDFEEKAGTHYSLKLKSSVTTSM
jgi:hypothetical protein